MKKLQIREIWGNMGLKYGLSLSKWRRIKEKCLTCEKYSRDSRKLMKTL